MAIKWGKEGREDWLTPSFAAVARFASKRRNGEAGNIHLAQSTRAKEREEGRKRQKWQYFGGGERITLEATIGITYHHIAKRDLTKPQKKEKIGETERPRGRQQIFRREKQWNYYGRRIGSFWLLFCSWLQKKSMGKEFRWRTIRIVSASSLRKMHSFPLHPKTRWSYNKSQLVDESGRNFLSPLMSYL